MKPIEIMAKECGFSRRGVKDFYAAHTSNLEAFRVACRQELLEEIKDSGVKGGYDTFNDCVYTNYEDAIKAQNGGNAVYALYRLPNEESRR